MNPVYAVIEVQSSNTVTIKGVYSSFKEASKYAKTLYKAHLDYYKSEGTYDNVSETKYEALTQAFGGGQEFDCGWYVNELEYELDSPCEIQLN